MKILVSLALFFTVLCSPFFLKFILTGLIGPTFQFYFFILWLPYITLIFAILRGRREAVFTSLCVLTVVAFVLFSHRPDSLMNFQRQVLQYTQVLVPLFITSTIGFMFLCHIFKAKED